MNQIATSPRKPQASITSTESFAIRAQRSEQRRVVLWVAALGGLALLTLARRAMGGHVMSRDRMFYPSMAVYAVAIAIAIAQYVLLRRASRGSTILPKWTWQITGFIDLCVPTALLWIAAFASPRGPVRAMTSPSMLIFPMLILLSVLRLRPVYTLATGLASAAIHAGLAARAVYIESSPVAEYMVYFAYAVVLAFTGGAGMLVAREMRRHVREATDEAFALERAERDIAVVNHDLGVARQIQRGLLPAASPRFDGFDIAGMNTPAAQTGGDYYDWQEMPDGRLVVVMADVTGHGIGPALVMAVCRAYARASSRVINEPVPLMARLNELLHGDLPADRFITLAICVLNRDGRVELLSAGHGPSLLYQKCTGRITTFGGDGLPLGVTPNETYGPTATFAMSPGDALVLLTDGFFEWHRSRDDEQFGIRRLEQTLLACADQSAERIISTLDTAVRTFVEGSPQQDDMTIVVIKRS